MKRKKFLQRTVSLFLVLLMMISGLPFNQFAFAAVQKLTIRNVYQNFNRSEKIITIEDERIQSYEDKKLFVDRADVSWTAVTGIELIGDDIVKATLDKSWNINNTRISGKEQGQMTQYTGINENAIPEITSLETPLIGVNEPIIANGSLTLKNLADTTAYSVQVGSVTAKVSVVEGSEGNQIKIEPQAGSQFAQGSQDIVVTRRSSDNGYTLENIYVYKAAVQIVGEINLDGMTMFPSMGEPGSEVQFKRSNLNKYDVYFIKNLNDMSLFNSSNKVADKDFQWVSGTGNEEDVITVKVPNIDPGPYYIVFTNSNSLTEGIKARYTHNDQQFTIIKLSQQPTIVTVQPASAPSQTPTEITISGYFFAQHNIAGFTPDNSLKSENYSDGKINYGTGTLKIGNTDYRVKVQREFEITVGSILPLPYNFTFDPAKPNALNEFKVSTIALNLDKKETHDVMVRMKTTIEPETTTSSPTFHGDIVKEVVKEKAFVYEPATETPEVTEVSPAIIPIETDGINYCINSSLGELLLAIKGQKFLVSRYMQGTEEIVSYPKITLGGVTINTNKDRSSNEYKPISLQVFKGDKLVDGTEGNQLGDTILIKIKTGRKINQGLSIVSKDSRSIEICNPIRKSSDYSVAYNFDEVISFSLVDKNDFPIIKSVIPDLVVTEGGDDVVISGSNLRSGAQVYIDGKLVTGIKVKGDNSEISFKAPAGRSGVTQLQVINPDGGGIATHDFTYTITYTEPKLTALNPPEGTANTLLTLKGENFLRSDPTVQVSDPTAIDEFLIYRLIGSRVQMAGYDINSYNLSNNRIQLKKYVQGENGYNLRNPIFKTLSGGAVQLQAGYDSVILRDADTSSKKFYIITRDIRNNLAIEDGLGVKYSLRSDSISGQLEAVLNGTVYTIDQSTKGQLIFTTGTTTSLVLDAYTPYLIEAVKAGDITYNDITGNRVHFIDGNTLQVSVPPLVSSPWTGDGLYDVTVINPDTRKSTLTKAFRYYSVGRIIPVISDIIPDQGPDTGGNVVTLTGPDDSDEKTAFVDLGTKKTRVFIGAQEVPAADVNIASDGQEISFKMPAYNESIKEQGTDRITVPVVLVNPDGGSYSITYNRTLTVTRQGKEKTITGYTFVVPSSNPRINKDSGISPAEGSANGGYIVDIFGSDFRDFEPFTDLNGSGKWEEGEPYTNLDGDDKYTDSAPKDADHKKVSQYNEEYQVLTSPLLPKVYFGLQEAEIVDYNAGYLQVVVPPGTGEAGVYIVNNDSGISNTEKFKYLVSKPVISSILPAVGRKKGGELIEIQGSGFEKGNLVILGKELNTDGFSVEKQLSMPLVKAGDRTNKDLSRDDENSGRIQSFKASVSLPGGLQVNYDSSSSKLGVIIQSGDQTYKQDYVWNGQKPVFIDSSDLCINNDTTQVYPYKELIRFQITDNRLIVDGGYAPETVLSSVNLIQVTTPAYYTVGKVNLYVINPDGGQAAGTFEYKSPASSPQITNITRDNSSPEDKKVDSKDLKILRTNYRGKSEISIYGADFRENAEIQIGNIATIKPADIKYELPGKLSFTMPSIDEKYAIDQGVVVADKLQRVMVINADGASAKSDELVPPIYIIFTKGETTPKVTKITPELGPAAGGTVLTISGADFRSAVEGYTGKTLAIYFGDKKADTVQVIDANTLTVISPGNPAGASSVRVENPDSEVSNSNITYTYISSPHISAVVQIADANSRQSSISVEGGQEIKIKGSGFMDGAQVIFCPVIKDAGDSASGDIFYRVTSKVVSGKSSTELDPQTLTSGEPGTQVKLIDSETITVKTPAGKLDSSGIMIINPDKGASETYNDIVFELPGLDAPLAVKAELVNDPKEQTDCFIKINWNKVTGAAAYEVYAVVNNQSDFIGSTKLTSTIYTDIEADTTYKFIVKAIGDFGSSQPSAQSNAVTTSSTVGAPDKDGKIIDNNEQSKIGDTATVKIGTKDFDDKVISIDLTRGTLAGSKELVLIIPAKVVSSSRAEDIEVTGLDFALRLNPNAFQIDRLYQNKDKDEAGVKFKISPYKGSFGQGAGNSLSTAYLLSAQAYVGQESTTMDYLKENIQFVLDYDGAKADMRHLTVMALHRYDELKQKWATSYNWEGAGEGEMVDINRLGRYAVIGMRR